jgi:EmrB/QacA subfamily drug resistance transporter
VSTAARADAGRAASGAVPPPAMTHRQVLVVFSGLLLAMLLAALDSTIVSTALPTIVGELGGLTHLSWVVTAYLLAQTVVTPLYGKLGDLYGRKGVLQAAIVLFLVGSVLCGLSQNMTQLIVFRAIQGFGGGGLMVTSQAVVGDIVSPRERGRYQGIFGAVFGLSSIAGPLLGGYFTTHLSWRWIFYINIPLGALAMVVLAATLPAGVARVRHAIDYAGAALLAVALSAIILVADLGGMIYAWTSPAMLGLMVAAVLALGAFLLVERRAAEPVLPLRLFGNRTFSVGASVGLIVGFALFGAVTYLPLFLQVVKGQSPTASGLQMLPMMAGMLVTSIISGQLISRTGRYRRFPIAGTAIMSVGLLLLSRMTADTGMLAMSGIILLLGLGLGMVMQVLVLAVQNDVDYSDLGVATSGATLFRLIGGSVGTAVLGAILASRLATELAGALPAGASGTGVAGISPDLLREMPASLRAVYIGAFSSSLATVFLVATAVGAVGFLMSWLLPERPLRETVAAAAAEVGTEMGETFAIPHDPDSSAELLRGLASLADRDAQRQQLVQLVQRVGLELSPAAAWLLLRIDRDAHVDPAALARDYALDPVPLHAALAELHDRDLVLTRPTADPTPRHDLTDAGYAAIGRLAAGR